jgi:hypothetical protein
MHFLPYAERKQFALRSLSCRPMPLGLMALWPYASHWLPMANKLHQG